MVEMGLFQYNLKILQQMVLRKHYVQNSYLALSLCGWKLEKIMQSLESSSQTACFTQVTLQSTVVFYSQEVISHVLSSTMTKNVPPSN